MLIMNCHSFAMTRDLFKFLKKKKKRFQGQRFQRPRATARLCPMERTASAWQSYTYV